MSRGDQWDGGPIKWVAHGAIWGTNEMGDQWDGGSMRWGTNEMGDQWCAPDTSTSHVEFVDTCVGPIKQMLHTLVGHINGNQVGVQERHTGQWKFASCTGVSPMFPCPYVPRFMILVPMFPMFPGPYVPQKCSPVPLFPKFILPSPCVPQYPCFPYSPVPMFPIPCAPQSICFPVPINVHQSLCSPVTMFPKLIHQFPTSIPQKFPSPIFPKHVPQQCCGKCKILVRPTDHPSLMVEWSV